MLNRWYCHLEFLLKKYLIHFTSFPFIVASRNLSIFLLQTNNYILVFAKGVTIYKIIQNLCKMNLCKLKLCGLGDYCIWVILCTFSIMLFYYYLYALKCVVSLPPHCSLLALTFSCSITKIITLFSSVWCLQFYWHEEHTWEVCDLSSTQPQTTSMGNFLFHVWVNYFVVEIQDFWIGMLCWLVNIYVHLAEFTACHQVLGLRLFLDCWALEMIAVPSSKISVAVCQLTSQKTLTSTGNVVRTSKLPSFYICNLYN